MNRAWKRFGIGILAGAALAGLAVLVFKDQISRHQRNLFSSNPLRRRASLGYLAQGDATVDKITLLRDFLAWEPRSLLRNRARVILKRMEGQAGDLSPRAMAEGD